MAIPSATSLRYRYDIRMSTGKIHIKHKIYVLKIVEVFMYDCRSYYVEIFKLTAVG